MSLDVYLTRPGQKQKYEARIFVREDGGTKELTRAEWDERFPGREPVVMEEEETDEVFSANITHNLNRMAGEAGIYKHLWRPDEIGITKAAQLIEPLEAGLALMRADPDRFKKHNPPNGWGDYDGFVTWIEEYLAACKENPDAEVKVWR